MNSFGRWRNSALYLVLFLLLVVFLLLRIRWVDHLLAWDEAMNLCSVRALWSGGEDVFANWFWRHPPIYTTMMLLLAPLKAGFAERSSLLSISIAFINVLLLFALNRRLFGRTIALWSVFLMAVIPGSVFFDIWIKRDQPAVSFGLLALLFLFSRRSLWAGLCLGFAFLSKESGVFYLFAACGAWLSGALGSRKVSDLLALVITPVLVCGWWYVAVIGDSGGVFGNIIGHVKFSLGAEAGWVNPWYFYLKRLVGDLGWGGILLASAGFIVLIVQIAWKRGAGSKRVQALWPIFLVVPGYLLLSVLRSKVPWIVISIYPAWATLQAVGVSRCAESVKRPILVAAFSVCVAAFGLWPVCGRDYEQVFRETAPGQWRGAFYSREAALAMNGAVDDGERALVTSFHYWKGLCPGHPCAVFAYYFERDAEVLIRSHERSFRNLVRDIRKYKLDWALLSPEPGTAEAEVLGGFMEELQLAPIETSKALIFRTTGLYSSASGSLR